MGNNNPYLKNPSTDFKKIDKLDRKKASSQAEKLREAIEYHNRQYYVKNNPVISDEAYDKLFKRLQQLEKAFPEIEEENSPTKRVGVEPVDELGNIEHQGEMLSLDSGLEKDIVKNFLDTLFKENNENELKIGLEPKLDGLSIEIVYENGEFSYGATRGDGRTGEDISENLRTVNSIPLKLQKGRETEVNIPSFLSVRGELLMPKDGFQKLNKERVEMNKDPYANPRNAAAGIVRQLDSKKVAGKPFDIYFYDILDVKGVSLKNQEQLLNTLPSWGLKTNPESRLISGVSKEKIFQKIMDYRNNLSAKRDELDYEIDGIVIKLDNFRMREQIGKRERSPRWAKAWKFPPKEDKTILEDIVIQVGRTGMLTPVALLEPVDVDGVTVSRATLHNESEVRKKNLHPGDMVKIKRAGDVIPEVEGRVKDDDEDTCKNNQKKEKEDKFSMPENCPVCGTEVIKEGAYYFCPNGLSCEAQLVGSITHYAERDAADIDHLGEKVAKLLVENDLINDLSDIYYLKKEKIKELPGFADKSAENLIQSIKNSRDIRLDRFIYGLGIRHVGSHLGRILAEEYDSLQSLIGADIDELLTIDEIGEKVGKSIISFFDDQQNLKTIEKMKEAGLKIRSLKIEKDSPIAGKTFVFTGQLDNYTRDEAVDKVENMGADAAASVSSNTDYLVVGKQPGSKLDRAREKGIKEINEEEFEKLLKQ